MFMPFGEHAITETPSLHDKEMDPSLEQYMEQDLSPASDGQAQVNFSKNAE